MEKGKVKSFLKHSVVVAVQFIECLHLLTAIKHFIS